MRKISFDGWNSGLLKIDTTRLFQQYFNLSLKASKDLTDKLLEGQTFSLVVPENGNSKKMVEDFTKTGVKCMIQDTFK